ncbi:Putative ribosomal N-acetyltransferase YdaF [Aquicella siphonis]|uniref:Ribosomal N-acetyltransferase YdaF n=1 Tax=Aquicella siphonis TaxID=254247 RepID=A0A5E4PHJ6_9COXI|nr:GNAT family protein [Aquicella siphonis]VVC75843.1 Putative ribosomal N-acetyltransferase YdaF [Aquicella siphonis]
MIIGHKIQLRLIKESDLPKLYDAWHDAESRGPYYPLALVPEPVFREEFAKNGFWSSDSQRLLIVDDKDNMLGIIHCAKASTLSDSVELSYFIFDHSARKKGYATEAVKLLVDFIFNQRRLNRIQILIPAGNDASVRVAEKVHFTHEGIARGAFYLNGEDIDLHIYSLLRKEWAAGKSRSKKT